MRQMREIRAIRFAAVGVVQFYDLPAGDTKLFFPEERVVVVYPPSTRRRCVPLDGRMAHLLLNAGSEWTSRGVVRTALLTRSPSPMAKSESASAVDRGRQTSPMSELVRISDDSVQILDGVARSGRELRVFDDAKRGPHLAVRLAVGQPC